MCKIINFNDIKEKYYKFRCKPCPNNFKLNFQIDPKESINKINNLLKGDR